VRRSTAIRAAAVTALGAGLAAPLVRRRLRLPPPVVTGTAALAPFALCVLFPRTRARDVGACALQMWAYVATYEMPNDDPAALERRVRVAYPVLYVVTHEEEVARHAQRIIRIRDGEVAGDAAVV